MYMITYITTLWLDTELLIFAIVYVQFCPFIIVQNLSTEWVE